MIKVAIVFGTRPEIIKIDPVIKELEKKQIETVLIHTGQHNLQSLFKDLKIKQPDYLLDLPPKSAGKFKGSLFKGIGNAAYWSLLIVKKIRRILKKVEPDVLLYQGDTLAIASASIAGRLFLRRPLSGHIEAGLRTGDIFNPFPEELARRIADKTSDFLFAPTAGTVKNLKVDVLARGKIFLTGNTIVDAVLQHVKLTKKKKLSLPKKFGIVFIHRQENVHSKQNLLNLYAVLSRIDEKIIFVKHPTLMQKLKDFDLLNKFERLPNVLFKPFYDYIPFLKVLSNAQYIITDAGGIQEEVCSLRLPCLVWRKKTERQEAIKAGAVVLVDNDWKLTLGYINQIKQKAGFYKKVKKCKNPYGDGKAAERIVKILLRNVK